MRYLITLLTFLLISPVFGQHYSEPDSTQLQLMRMSASSTEWDLWVNEVAAINNETITDEYEEYDDWVEIYNFGDEAVDLHQSWVSDDPDEPQMHQLLEQSPGELIIPPGGFMILWADNQPEQGAKHLSFSLSGDGEFFGIYQPDNFLLIDGIAFDQQISDVTYGRIPDGGMWNYFPEPTPGEANTTEGLFGIAPKPEFSQNNAFTGGSVSVEISVDDPLAEIRYTLNGSEPTQASALYAEPLLLEGTIMLRARAFKEECLPSRIATNTFIDEEGFDLDVISLVTDSSNLWGPEGIYDNRFTGLEKPIHIEYFNNAGVLQFEIDAGVKNHAPDNRPQQSLRLYARSNYGDTYIYHQIFEDKDLPWYKRLILRNGANDGQQLARTHFRDGMAHRIFSEIDPDNIYSAHKPVNVYLNGEYWGIYNLRERQDQHFIESNYGYTDVDFLERTATTADTRDQRAGDWEDYDAMRDYLMENDMSDPEHYEVITDWIDIRNYVDYMITEIWTANRDWMTNNIKYYRPRNMPETKWKWILWDTEYGMGCYPANDHGDPDFDALHMSMSWGGWPPFWGTETSTYMMDNLKANPEFVEYFITRHADLLNAWLRPDRVQDKIDEMVELYSGDIPRQIDRWGYSMSLWENAINTLEDWNAPRASYCREHIMNKWDHVIDEHVITLEVEPEGAGYIEVNTIFTDENPWQGYYFEGVPVNLNAVANIGYDFVEWIEPGVENTQLEVWLEGDSALTALFEPSEFIPGFVVINEINYNSGPFAATEDWVELTNPGDAPVDLENWIFKDGNDNNQFIFGEGITLESGAFLLLCENPDAFEAYNPGLTNVHGPFNFGLSGNGELLRLYNATGDLIDWVDYGVVPPWPISPNGLGPTLELSEPVLDNTLPENWFARDDSGGTPGAPNTFITSSPKDSPVDLKIFPNPSEGFFNVLMATDVNLPVQLEVFNPLGQKILSEQFQSSNWNIDLRNQSPGLYSARISAGGEFRTVRLLIR